MAETEAPFLYGDIVMVKGGHHLGRHHVDSCEWFTGTSPGVPHYWLVECSVIREPIDWSKIPAGATGIIAHAGWRGSADHLEPAPQGPST